MSERFVTATAEDPGAGPLDIAGRAPALDLDVRWIHGHPRGSPNVDPPIHVHAADAHTFILRQSMAVSHEAPYLYLLLGNDRALLIDTGATANADRFPLRITVDGIIEAWLERHPRARHELVIAHSHGHADHTAADAQFDERPDTTLIPPDPAAMATAFDMPGWPDGTGRLDLGGRVLEVIATPGHHPSAITVFDPWTGFLLTGDTIYPGRLFVADSRAYVASLGRLESFAAERRISFVMGCHVEMSSVPGRDYPMGARYQPEELPLPMTPDRLGAVRSAMAAVAHRRGVHPFDDFIIYNRPRLWSLLRVIARSLRHRLSG